MNERVNPSLLETLKSLEANTDADISFLFAAITNLHIEACRRLHGRVLLKPQDIEMIFTYINSILAAKIVDDYAPADRPRALLEEEIATVLNAGRRV